MTKVKVKAAYNHI